MIVQKQKEMFLEVSNILGLADGFLHSERSCRAWWIPELDLALAFLGDVLGSDLTFLSLSYLNYKRKKMKTYWSQAIFQEQ